MGKSVKSHLPNLQVNVDKKLYNSKKKKKKKKKKQVRRAASKQILSGYHGLSDNAHGYRSAISCRGWKISENIVSNQQLLSLWSRRNGSKRQTTVPIKFSNYHRLRRYLVPPVSHFCQSLDAWLIEGFDVKSSNHWHLQLITYTLFVLLFHVIRSFCRIYFDFAVYHFGPFINLVVIVVLGSLIFKRKKKKI